MMRIDQHIDQSSKVNRLVGWGYGLLNNPPALAEKNIFKRDKD